MKEFLTPKQVARAIGVSESSLKRWCDRGLIPTIRTGGGHRRLVVSGVLAFLRQTNRELVEPEQLGLPATSGVSDRMTTRGRDNLRESLLAGDEPRCRQIIFDHWLSGLRLSVICDQVIAGAFTDIGERWACSQTEVWEERRACEIIVRVLHEVRIGIPISARTEDLVAMGGTAEGDPYVIPTTAAELVLLELGWKSRSLGSSIPFASLSAAIRTHRPRLFWLSVSYIADPAVFIREFAQLHSAATESRTAIVVGGFALEPAIRQQLRYAAYCDTMQHLEEFANSMSPPPSP